MTVEEIRLWVDFQLNKNQTGGTLSPEEYNLCLSWANQEYFKLKYGLPEQYRPGQPLPAQAWAVSQENIDALSPFLKAKGGRDYPKLKIDIDGRADIPSDYVHYSSIRYNDKAVEILSNDVIGNRLQSPIVYPDKKYPIGTFYAGYIQFYPKDLGYVDFDYLRLPSTPVWAYTIVNDVAVYNPTASIELEWSAIYHMDIANLILGYAANNLRDQLAIQLANNRKNTGQ